MKWQRKVNLLVKLYPKIISRATGERKRVNRFMKPVVKIKRMELIMINTAAALVPTTPEGISLLFVLGLSASKFLSASLLNPIAAFRAKIMHSIISRSSLKLKSNSSFDTASEKPIRAKGIAKIV
jgi:hypothetical protein